MQRYCVAEMPYTVQLEAESADEAAIFVLHCNGRR